MIAHFNNTPIYYEITGKGPALVLLHGFLETSTMWSRLIPEFSSTRTVVTIDLPGHGKSGCIAETHSMELMAEVVAFILKLQKIPTATFVGHSMGGYVTLAFAEHYEDAIDNLILLNSTPAADSKTRKENRNRALVAMDKNKDIFIGMAIRNLFAEKVRLKYAIEIEQLKNEAILFPKEGIMAAIRGMRDRKDRISVLKNFSKKKHLIYGNDDPLIPVNISVSISKSCKIFSTKLTGGHLILTENYHASVKTLHLIV